MISQPLRVSLVESSCPPVRINVEFRRRHEVDTISDPVMGVPLCAVETVPLPVLTVPRPVLFVGVPGSPKCQGKLGNLWRQQECSKKDLSNQHLLQTEGLKTKLHPTNPQENRKKKQRTLQTLEPSSPQKIQQPPAAKAIGIPYRAPQVPTDESAISIEVRALNHEMVATRKARWRCLGRCGKVFHSFLNSIYLCNFMCILYLYSMYIYIYIYIHADISECI